MIEIRILREVHYFNIVTGKAQQLFFGAKNGSQRGFSQRWVECKIIQNSRKNAKENTCS